MRRLPAIWEFKIWKPRMCSLCLHTQCHISSSLCLASSSSSHPPPAGPRRWSLQTSQAGSCPNLGIWKRGTKIELVCVTSIRHCWQLSSCTRLSCHAVSTAVCWEADRPLPLRTSKLCPQGVQPDLTLLVLKRGTSHSSGPRILHLASTVAGMHYGCNLQV